MTIFNYNFSFTTKENKDDDPRKGLRITKCCGNCKYYWYDHAKERRGYCKLPNPDDKKYAVDKTEAKANWPKTHTTMVCDFHRFRSIYASITRIGIWLNKHFDNDGNLTD